MLSLFKRTNISSLPVYAIRGNHDSEFDWTKELQLTMDQTQCELPSFYYTKFVQAGENGEVMGMLFVDSVLMLCSNYTAMQIEKTPLKNPDLIRLRATTCANSLWVNWGNTQYSWILETLAEWDKNPKIIWRAAV